VPELGAWLQQQAFILVAPGKYFMPFLGGALRQGKEVRMTGSHILPASMMCYSSSHSSPFPLLKTNFFFSFLL
jgi:hypothetical protein